MWKDQHMDASAKSVTSATVPVAGMCPAVHLTLPR